MQKKAGPGFYIFLTVFIFIIMFPFYWEFLTSIKTPDEIFTSFKLYTTRPSINSYVTIFSVRPFARYLYNSFIVGSVTTVFSIIIASFTAYAIARLKFKGKSIILGIVLAVSMFPQIAIISPVYLFMKTMGLRNTYLGLIIPYTTFTLPLSVWYLTTFFKEIPFSLEEAAKIDGASPFQAFIKIIAPLAMPGVFTTAILVFIAAWNEYLFALTINPKEEMKTVPVGITMYVGQYTIPWGEIAAAAVVVTVPLIIMVLIFQKRIISGLTSGAVKG
ncbi:MAG: trehalose/maltose transport system permease protein [Petroclostridium sp.]|jgi:multiple sugar transport system permease protein|uniref:carbohydrate ABC transporter permease n=1 Tax=Petroclostridium xylanilyticum TaxID=1792311 RepID=UPI000B981677|nr:carbohydrate ABC transporter permease [Petroclostridium xylanilyticum]MBZ4646855.1 binding--dependent transport system inner rane component family protein [Clostridia bacterium]MDK2810516.1 trehalose/maltose transport system permease protein [Petroclostridium sp.]